MTPDYTQWQSDPDDLHTASVLIDYAEFSGQTIESVVKYVLAFKELTAQDFRELSEPYFYSYSINYIYDILSANVTPGMRANLLQKFIPNALQIIRDHPGTTFGDFGAGVGVMCELAHTFCGKKVTHIDIPSHHMDFAYWRYRKYDWHINIHPIPTTYFELYQTFDILYTDAVWEHLPPEHQIQYALQLSQYLNPGGLLFFLVDLSGPSEDMPMHYPVDITEVHHALTMSGLTCLGGQHNFASVWRK